MIAATSSYFARSSVAVPICTVIRESSQSDTVLSGATVTDTTWAANAGGSVRATARPGAATEGSEPPTAAGGTGPQGACTTSTATPGVGAAPPSRVRPSPL